MRSGLPPGIATQWHCSTLSLSRRQLSPLSCVTKTDMSCLLCLLRAFFGPWAVRKLSANAQPRMVGCHRHPVIGCSPSLGVLSLSWLQLLPPSAEIHEVVVFVMSATCRGST